MLESRACSKTTQTGTYSKLLSLNKVVTNVLPGDERVGRAGQGHRSFSFTKKERNIIERQKFNYRRENNGIVGN